MQNATDCQNNPLWAKHFADAALSTNAAVIENEQTAKETYRLRLHCPGIAKRIVPGQFVMVRCEQSDGTLLGRPFALYDAWLDENGAPAGIDVVFLVVGKVTRQLATLTPGAKLEVWGPLGNGFAASDVKHLIMVAGGIGQTPFLALAKEALQTQAFGSPPRASGNVENVTLCYGARSEEYLAGVEDFKQAGVDVRISTDDGTAGHHGLVTDLLSATLDEQPTNSKVVCCGPEPMLEAVAKLCAHRNVPCDVSLETPMACGVGICFSCVAKVRQPDGEWDYKRTCVDGPVFDAAKIVW